MMSKNLRVWISAALSGLTLAANSVAASCSPAAPDGLQTEQTGLQQTLDKREARMTYLQSAQLKLAEIRARAQKEFGDHVPTPEEFDDRVLKLRAELAAMLPQVPETPASQERAARIQALTLQLQMAQQQSAKDWAKPENQSAEARRALEQRIRAEFQTLSGQLSALVDAQNAEREAAIADKAAVTKKRQELENAISYTELQDRQDLIDGAARTIGMYDQEIASERQRIDKLKAAGTQKDGDCVAHEDEPAKKS